MTNEAFSRVKIDAQLRDQAWEITNTNAVRFEYVLPDRTKADYVLCDRNGRSLAVVEAKKAATNPAEAEDQAKAYAAQLKVPYIFLANGNEIRFWEWQTEAFPRPVKTFFSRGDLERRAATAQVKRDVLSVEIDKHIVERDYQTDCIDALCREIKAGRRKLLVEMATVSGMGDEDTVDGMTKIKRFKKETFPQILVSVNMLDTGFDCPEVVSLVFARFTRSTILYQQMRGRGTRKSKGKPVFTMFDFVGVTDFHGDDEAVGEGCIVMESKPRPYSEPRKLLSLDVDDHIDPNTRAWVTIDEDGNLVFPEATEQQQAQVGARFEAWLLAREDEQTQLSAFPVLVPPLAAQENFRRQVEAVEGIGALQKAAAKKAEATFRSLLARAFTDPGAQVHPELEEVHA